MILNTGFQITVLYPHSTLRMFQIIIILSQSNKCLCNSTRFQRSHGISLSTCLRLPEFIQKTFMLPNARKDKALPRQNTQLITPGSRVLNGYFFQRWIPVWGISTGSYPRDKIGFLSKSPREPYPSRVRIQLTNTPYPSHPLELYYAQEQRKREASSQQSERQGSEIQETVREFAAERLGNEYKFFVMRSKG